MDTLNGTDEWQDEREPIAVIGIGCRFPGGADSPSAYWDLLVAGRDAIGTVPEDRWAAYEASGSRNAAALLTITKTGGFLDDIYSFDAGFFGISPREAALMDPQQRIALEVTWEALEHAGVSPSGLAGGDTGVYFGVNCDDYGRRLLEDLPTIEAWTGIGSSLCAVANRVSYALDLRGPSMVVDTACSSSLVAIDLACQNLRLGEIPLAIAGGVMLMAGPGLTLVMDAAGALSPDGRSKSFDASADGYGRGEGCGVLVLKRLSDARRDGDRILALIRGGAVKQDGRTNGIMAPNGAAQAYLFRQACEAAGVSPESLDYIEAHGTGTRVGDPIEAAAMAGVFGAGRPQDRPCLIGSVKSNIGHLEAASGVAGVIKSVLALQHGQIPPSLNLKEANPKISWADSGLRVTTELTPWPRTEHPRRAGVSGYGYGGTIAHLILEEAPSSPDAPGLADEPTSRSGEAGKAVALLFPLSGATREAVTENAQRLADWMSGPGADTPLADVAHTLSLRRAHLRARAAVVAMGTDELVKRLAEVGTWSTAAGVAVGEPLVAAGDPGPVWVFSGHGSQWSGMGRELLASDPVFAGVIAELDPIFNAEIGFTPRQVLLDGDLRETSRIQPMIFAMQVALAAVWRAHGLSPAAVIGHSVGEIAAAVVAGVFDLANGARLICRRSRLLRLVAGRGSMAMVNLSFDEVSERLSGRQDVVAAIAASPNSTVLAGDVSAMRTLVDQWRSHDRLFIREVDSDVAFHSRHMDPLLDRLVTAVDTIASQAPQLPIYTTALQDPRATAVRDGSYWAANLRNPVRFTQAVKAALDDDHRIFLEISAHPVVAQSISETLAAAQVEDALVAHTLRRNRPERATMLTNLGALYCAGVPIEWPRSGAAALTDLPGTAWRHQRYEAETTPPQDAPGRRHDPRTHTLLGSPLTVNGSPPSRLWQTDLDMTNRPYPGDHPVQGTEIVPAAVTLSTYLTAAGTGSLTDVALRVPVSIENPKTIQVSRIGGAMRLSSLPLGNDTESGWLTHSTAVAAATGTRVEGLGEPYCPHRLDPNHVIDRLASVGVAAMGFHWHITELRRGEDVLHARVSAIAEPGTDQTWAPLLDAALSTASVSFAGPPVLRMPAHMKRLDLLGPPPEEATLSVVVQRDGTAPDTVDVDIHALDGAVAARIRGLRYGVPDGGGGGRPVSPRRLVHQQTWRPLTLPAPLDGPLPGLVVVIGDVGLASRLGPALDAAAIRCVAFRDPDELAGFDEPATVLVAPPMADGPQHEAALHASSLLLRTLRLLPDGSRLWCLTRGVREAVGTAALSHSSLWGLGRVVAGERPECWGGILDLDADDPLATTALLLDVLRARHAEEVIALRGDGAHVARLVPLPADDVRTPVGCRPDGTYLITGGLGTLGLEVAHWLAGRGAQRMILAGRAGLPPRRSWAQITDPATLERIKSVRELEAAGVTVRPVALDISDPLQVARLLAPDAHGLPPIRGVVHAAGVLDNRLAQDVDEVSLRTVLRPKVGGALVLHELFPPGELDFLALFSSAGPLLGLPGQASYAAANAFLDGLARHRAAAGDTGCISFAWTSWRGLGMSTSSEVIDSELAARGTADITAADAFRAWEYAERHATPCVAVLRMLPQTPGAHLPPLLSELDQTDETGEPEGGVQPAQAQIPWAGLSQDELAAYIVEEVAGQVAAELHLPGEIDRGRPLVEAGLDSVMALIIRRRLEQHFRISLPTTLLWNRPTVEEISGLIAELLNRTAA